MKRLAAVIGHPIFTYTMSKIEEREKERFFCRHGMDHVLAVARILYILVLEEKLNVDKELVYATAVLHDIGRYEQYENGTPHNEAGALIAEKIMEDCDFSVSERAQAVAAIKGHRKDVSDGDVFSHLLYKADKLSRNCYSCEANSECYWEDEQKNSYIIY